MTEQIATISIILIIIIISAFFVLNGANEKDKQNNNVNNNSKIIEKNNKQASDAKTSIIETEFEGKKGETLSLKNGKITLDIENLDDGLARFYNTKLNSGKIIYFFVIKDKNGIYRAATNACQVCHKSKLGFIQEGNFMKCKTCGNKYPLEKIATEKGGCNPGPINPNLKIEDGRIIIQQAKLEEMADLF